MINFILIVSAGLVAIGAFLFVSHDVRSRQAKKQSNSSYAAQLASHPAVRVLRQPVVRPTVRPTAWNPGNLPLDVEALKEARTLLQHTGASMGATNDRTFQQMLKDIDDALKEVEEMKEVEETEEDRERREKEDAHMEICPECEKPFNVKDDYLCADCRASLS